MRCRRTARDPGPGMRVDEVYGRVDHRVRPVAMRRMAAVVELDEHGVRQRVGDAVDVRHRPVFVVASLDREDRAADRRQQVVDVEAAERLRQPHVVPSPERRVDVRVMAREPLAQVGPAIRDPRALDRVEAEALDVEMRRDDDQPRDAVRIRGRMDERDRPAVAVTEQPRRVDVDVDAERGEQRRQDVARLSMHEVGAPADVGRPRRRRPVAGSREDEAAIAAGRAQARREIAPHRHRAEAFVQEHEQRRRGRAVEAPVLDVDALAVDVDRDARRHSRPSSCDGIVTPAPRSCARAAGSAGSSRSRSSAARRRTRSRAGT